MLRFGTGGEGSVRVEMGRSESTKNWSVNLSNFILEI